jgi:hypothetical protein
MKDPTSAVTEAVFAKLAASAAVQAVLGNPIRVYDKVVDNPSYPFGRIGDGQAVGDSVQCFDGWDSYFTLHIFSRHEQYPKLEASDIATVCCQAIGNNDDLPAPSGFKIKEAILEDSRTFFDDDGVTGHTVVTIQYLVDDGA